MKPFISICIPAYNRADYLKKLLDSIALQTYKDFNIIITDDSPGDIVAHLAEQYKAMLPIVYYKNTPSLGPANNWNKGISLADGTWIKVMHDDDRFANADSLGLFAAAARDKTGIIFSAFNVLDERKNTITANTLSPAMVKTIEKNPYILFYNNLVGPPSVVMTHHTIKEQYDPRLKWFVDLEYYIRIIRSEPVTYLPELAIEITYNDTQVTNSCFRKREVEIPESLFLYRKFGDDLTKTITQYDEWWRLLRNLEIRSLSDFSEHAGSHKIPPFIIRLINFQQKFPLALLQRGYISKLLMLLHYYLGFKTAKSGE